MKFDNKNLLIFGVIAVAAWQLMGRNRNGNGNGNGGSQGNEGGGSNQDDDKEMGQRQRFMRLRRGSQGG